MGIGFIFLVWTPLVQWGFLAGYNDEAARRNLIVGI